MIIENQFYSDPIDRMILLYLDFSSTNNQQRICTEKELCYGFCMKYVISFVAVQVIVNSKNGVNVICKGL